MVVAVAIWWFSDFGSNDGAIGGNDILDVAGVGGGDVAATVAPTAGVVLVVAAAMVGLLG